MNKGDLMSLPDIDCIRKELHKDCKNGTEASDCFHMTQLQEITGVFMESNYLTQAFIIYSMGVTTGSDPFEGLACIAACAFTYGAHHREQEMQEQINILTAQLTEKN
jgi:hypothetical protein